MSTTFSGEPMPPLFQLAPMYRSPNFTRLVRGDPSARCGFRFSMCSRHRFTFVFRHSGMRTVAFVGALTCPFGRDSATGNTRVVLPVPWFSSAVTDDRDTTVSMNGNPASTRLRFSARVMSVPSPSPEPVAHTLDTRAWASVVTDSDTTGDRAAVVSKSWTVSEWIAGDADVPCMTAHSMNRRESSVHWGRSITSGPFCTSESSVMRLSI